MTIREVGVFIAGSSCLLACNGILGIKDRYYDASGGAAARTRGNGSGETDGGVESGAGGVESGAGGAESGGRGGGGGAGALDGGTEGGGAASVAIVCTGSSADCDDDPSDCETDLDAIVSCGKSCTSRVACTNTNAKASTCSSGKCDFTCKSGFADCDGKGENGCEADLDSSLSCGAGCQVCVWPSPVCSSGKCVASPSCEGLDSNCGPLQNASCCDSTQVPGGTFNRDKADSSFPATVGGFRFDAYEVTVGRWKNFAAAWVAGYRPKAGAGKHIHLNDGKGLATVPTDTVPAGFESGWDPAWEAKVTAPGGEWEPAQGCTPMTVDSGRDTLPINCVNWWEMAAFCTWDEGFLPSEAEWEYAAAGGSLQRSFPWGDTAQATPAPGTNPTFAVISCLYDSNGAPTGGCGIDNLAAVGTLVAGKGSFGQFDLGGNVAEWTLDYAGNYALPCVNCTQQTPASDRETHGGAFADQAFLLSNDFRNSIEPFRRYSGHGARCARRP